MKNNLIKSRELNDFIVLSLLLIFAVLPLVFHLYSGYIPVIWLDEDGIYESIAAIACIVTGFALVWHGMKSYSSSKIVVFWLFFFAFSLLILGGEELSWGQRVFSFETPENIANNNFQGEFNLHNSKLIQSHNNKLSVYLTKLLVVYLIIFPLFLRAFPSAYKFAKRISIPVPSLAIVLATLIAKLINNQTYKTIYGSTDVVDILSLGEAYESILELSLCWVAWNYINFIKQNRKE